MDDDQWTSSDRPVLSMFLNGDLVEHDQRGQPVTDDRLLVGSTAAPAPSTSPSRQRSTRLDGGSTSTPRAASSARR